MKKSLLLLCLIFLVMSVEAQTPTFGWAVKMGGSAGNQGRAIATDKSGNIYTTGYFNLKEDFDPGEDTFNLYAGEQGTNIFISKLNASGHFVWAKNMGGNDNFVTGRSIAIDDSGNVYTSGIYTDTADFDPNENTYNLVSAGFTDIFISKLDPLGNFVWAKKIGGIGHDFGFSMALDPSGNVYATGMFEGTSDFDPGAGIYNLTSMGDDEDIFILKLDPSGNFVWAKKIGGTGHDYGHSIATDNAGNVFTYGSFDETTDFDPGSGTFNLTPASLGDAFILKLDASGNFAWAKMVHIYFSDQAQSIAADESGNIYTTGVFDGRVDFDPDTAIFYLTSKAYADAFVLKLDAAGNFIWAKDIGGTRVARGYSITVEENESPNVYITGFFEQTVDFDPGVDTFNLTSVGDKDIFVLNLDVSGNFIWAINLGGTKFDAGYSIATGGYHNIYISGDFTTTVDFDPGVGKFNLSSSPILRSNIFILNIKAGINARIENTQNNKILIYPNPSTGILNIESKELNYSNLKIQILNSLGQIVMEETGIQHSQLDIQHLSEGLYLVRVISDNQIIATQKIIKQ